MYMHINSFLSNKSTRLRASIRGYNILRSSNNLTLIRDIKNSLAVTPLRIFPKVSGTLSFLNDFSELHVRQYILQYHIAPRLHKSILVAIGSKTKVVFPLPLVWLHTLSSHGLKVNYTLSLLLWAIYLFSYSFKSYLKSLSFLVKLFFLRNKSLPRAAYTYFSSLSPANIPSSSHPSCNFTILDWYSQWVGRDVLSTIYCHSVNSQDINTHETSNVQYIVPPYYLLTGTSNHLFLLFWFFRHSLSSFCKLFLGQWWHSYLLCESIHAKSLSLTHPTTLARDYLIPFSSNTYRPLWTYVAESFGSRILTYFYSISEQPTLSTGIPSQSFEYGACSWSNYLVFDHFQKNLLSRSLSQPSSIDPVGPIWFSDSSEPLAFTKPTIAVFDYELYRLSSHLPFSTLADYWSAFPNLDKLFFNDILTIAVKYNFDIAFKGKRTEPTRSRKTYLSLIRDLSEHPNFILVPPSVSPFRLNMHCSAAISMPFTSTALSTINNDFPTVYYDPTRWILAHDPSAHGVPILSGIEQLEAWMTSLSHNND